MFILSYQFILCLFEAFQFYARTSHTLQKVRPEKSGSLYRGSYVNWVATFQWCRLLLSERLWSTDNESL